MKTTLFSVCLSCFEVQCDYCLLSNNKNVLFFFFLLQIHFEFEASVSFVNILAFFSLSLSLDNVYNPTEERSVGQDPKGTRKELEVPNNSNLLEADNLELSSEIQVSNNFY